MLIGVVGVGFVGGAVSKYFQGLHPAQGQADVIEHDPPKGLHRSADLERCDFIFVCVPTPYWRDGGFDDSYVRDAVSQISGNKIVVVKSTVVPGTTDRVQLENQRHKVLFNPEFLRERCAFEDFVAPDRQIVGCGADAVGEARQLLEILPRAKHVKICTRKQAEMVKYFSNCFLSMKVTFANQLFELCEAIGVEYDEVRRMAEGDPRLGPGYLEVSTDGYRGYGGTCFPKDMRALIQLGRKAGAPQALLEKCEELNNALLEQAGKTEWLP